MKEKLSKITKKDGIRLGAFAASQLMDVGTTIIALHNNAIEINLVQNLLIENYGETGLVLTRLLGIAAISYLYLADKITDKDFETKKFGMKNIIYVATAIFLTISASNGVTALLSR